MKGSKKAWEDFITWLRNKNTTTVKDFDYDCEWEWTIGEESKKLHAKENEEEHNVCRKVDENDRQGVCEFEESFIDVEELTKGVIGVFVNNKLRIVDKEKDFIHDSNIEINDVTLDE